MLILLTGATGFLGSHLCKALLERGHKVGAFRRPSSIGWRLGDLASQVRWHELPRDLEAAFSEPEIPDALIHCAALYGRRGESLVDIIDANIRLPIHLYELAAARGVPAFLNTDSILDPRLNPYALSKHHAAEWLSVASGPTRVLNLKLQHFFGPDDDSTKFITWLIRESLSDIPEIRLTDGQQWRDFIYVTDVVSAIVTLVESGRVQRGLQDIAHRADPVTLALCPSDGERVGHARVASAGDAADSSVSDGGARFVEYEIGSGQPIQVRELVEHIHRLTAGRSRLLYGAVPYRPGEPMRTQANIAALQALGWQPQVSFEEGLARTVQAERERIRCKPAK